MEVILRLFLHRKWILFYVLLRFILPFYLITSSGEMKNKYVEETILSVGYEITHTELCGEHLVIGEEDTAQGNLEDKDNLELWLQENFFVGHEKVCAPWW